MKKYLKCGNEKDNQPTTAQQV